MKRIGLPLLCAAVVSVCVAGCGFRRNKPVEIRLLAGSEHRSLEFLLRHFEERNRVKITVTYAGSADIMRALRSDTLKADAVWPADGLWIRLGDEQRRIKDIRSVYVSPVVLGIRRTLADSLGFGREAVPAARIFEHVLSGRIRLAITSPDHSNSGMCALLMMLRATTGIPDERTLWSIESSYRSGEMRQLIRRIHRGTVSSGWLQERFIIGGFDGMVNYESMVIEANLQLQRLGREPLWTFYPSDGVYMCDAPIGSVETGNRQRESAVRGLQDFLLSPDVQRQLAQSGRRPADGIRMTPGLMTFHPDWGLDFGPVRPLADWPADAVIEKAVLWYRQILSEEPTLLSESEGLEDAFPGGLP